MPPRLETLTLQQIERRMALLSLAKEVLASEWHNPLTADGRFRRTLKDLATKAIRDAHDDFATAHTLALLSGGGAQVGWRSIETSRHFGRVGFLRLKQLLMRNASVVARSIEEGRMPETP